MKIGIITDVHGNGPALKAVLQEIDTRKEIERIYCLGDMIGIGPDTNEVLGLLFSRKDISMITGNHDEAILALLKREEYPLSHTHTKVHHQWIADNMDKSYIPNLEKLPRTIDTIIEGHSVLFTHYHIKESKRNSHISQDSFSEIVEASFKPINDLFKGYNKELICFGHNHPVHFFQSKKTAFLNPGSLGCNLQPIASYAIANIDKEKIEISLEKVAYDNSFFLESYETLKVPDREFIINIFHGDQNRKDGRGV
ncbi:metallophosphoesterase family protein [Niallia sp.]|uniref:metallophosphoesterase family protein n=1 Tax=Niallia sp. TaxID=2837523 RepID=UPI0028967AD2|nr:metallophosphoesterase family protein [Niallia sp.]